MLNPLDTTTHPGEAAARRVQALEERVASLEGMRSNIPCVEFTAYAELTAWQEANKYPGLVAIVAAPEPGKPEIHAVWMVTYFTSTGWRGVRVE
jgi:hypothetical protein